MAAGTISEWPAALLRLPGTPLIGSMLHPSLVERITRSLAYMLRHQPEQFDLELDEYGYADLVDVVAALNERLGEPVEAQDVSQAV